MGVWRGWLHVARHGARDYARYHTIYYIDYKAILYLTRDGFRVLYNILISGVKENLKLGSNLNFGWMNLFF